MNGEVTSGLQTLLYEAANVLMTRVKRYSARPLLASICHRTEMVRTGWYREVRVKTVRSVKGDQNDARARYATQNCAATSVPFTRWLARYG
jgi:hypothetical protein